MLSDILLKYQDICVKYITNYEYRDQKLCYFEKTIMLINTLVICCYFWLFVVRIFNYFPQEHNRECNKLLRELLVLPGNEWHFNNLIQSQNVPLK